QHKKQNSQEPRREEIKKTPRQKEKKHDHGEEQQLIEHADKKIRLVAPEPAAIAPKRFRLSRGRNGVFKRQDFHQTRQHKRIHRRVGNVGMLVLDLRELSGVAWQSRPAFLFIMFLEQIHAEGADEQRAVAFAL